VIDYLVREVPRWSKENHCFSCHNNGDAARALYLARSLGYRVPDEALADTTAWLLRPQGWDESKGDPGFSDKKLARIQFAAALAQALETEVVTERQPLIAAVEALLAEQDEDGSWRVDASGALGSPATYGMTLATYAVRQTFVTAGPERFADAIVRADAWFLTLRPRTTVDAAALTLALASRKRAEQHTAQVAAVVPSKIRETLDWILRSQASDGGWGPYPKSPSEAFDTAIALLALADAGDMNAGDKAILATKIAAGRRYLITTQLPEGGWTETTRPSGNQSYAQHISTSGWAALALLKTVGFDAAARH
jgi:squalene cyclase